MEVRKNSLKAKNSIKMEKIQLKHRTGSVFRELVVIALHNFKLC